MTPETPRTPLTLEFAPDNGGDDEPYRSIVVCEPSFEITGRIFLGVNPLGKRLGVHLLPEEAKKIRDHLTKLLLERAEDQSEPVVRPLRAPETPPGSAESIQSRIDRAVERLKAKKDKKRKRFLFKLEFQVGDVQGVIGRLRA